MCGRRRASLSVKRVCGILSLGDLEFAWEGSLLSRRTSSDLSS